MMIISNQSIRRMWILMWKMKIHLRMGKESIIIKSQMLRFSKI